jgi:hypothetical protein
VLSSLRRLRRRSVASFGAINPKAICVIGVICGQIAREARRDTSHRQEIPES